ncbi:uncharacterized protein LOC106666411 [Cimex lectularius]|uniref:Essential protein Yae1 N-terminal domain-containing protein n=1 Tax=Cimex lectularius TaxID=79782 RepID=A0A8I6THD7_CIMLE|nr:uncharacterized protein LOC106666411 [Cimex lectularius]
MEKDEELEISVKNWEKVTEPIKQDGFREGFESGRLNSFQSGFDIGYSAGFKAGFTLAYYNAALRVVDEVRGKMESASLGLEGRVFEKAERGACALCPKVNRRLTKADMANAVPLEDSTIDDLVEKQKLETRNVMTEKEKEIKWLDSFLPSS